MGAILTGLFAKPELISSYPAGLVLTDHSEDAYLERTGSPNALKVLEFLIFTCYDLSDDLIAFFTASYF